MKTIVFVVASLAVAGSAQAAIEVTGDGACPYYAVDIESFATCDGDRVARASSASADGAKASLTVTTASDERQAAETTDAQRTRSGVRSVNATARVGKR